MKIRHRIALLVMTSFLAIGSIGGYSIWQARTAEQEVKSVTEETVPSALASADLVSHMKDVQLATLSLVYAPDQALAQQAKESLATAKTRLSQSLSIQATQAAQGAQKGLVGQADESLAAYFAAVDDTATLKLTGKTAMAEANFAATVTQYQRELEGIVSTLRIEKNRSKDQAIANLNEGMSATATTITSVTILAIIVLGIAGFLLYRQIVDPISSMQSMMTEIAESQNFAQRVPVVREDEIGHSIKAFNQMLEKIEESSKLLRQKTNDIQTILRNVPQGILTVGTDQRIHHEYSAHLEVILESTAISGRNVTDLLFEGSSLGTDARAQVEAAVAACLGEDIMNFDFNEHLLVGELEKAYLGGRKKILDVNWSPIVDGETIVSLLLCVRDVTELRKLAAEANDQKRELTMIGEILSVSQEKFFDFTSNATKLLDENERLIHGHPLQDAEIINHLYRNMHTVKGNARTFGLKQLTNVAHETERSYDELRKKYPDIVWDQGSLLSELGMVRDALSQYVRISEVSLGRRGPGRRGNIERFLLVDRSQIDESLHRLEQVNTANLHELLAARDAVRHVLRLLGTEPIGEILSGAVASLPSLAAELGKLPPIVEIDDHGLVVKNQASSTLKNAFVHLVRNSIDHGIETPEERRALGKPQAGSIRMELDIVGPMLEIRFHDDGFGLPLTHLRRKAVEVGLLPFGTQISDEEVANLIFRPGVSTAERVTEVSGRGVGMDAVLNFVKREGGKVELRFRDANVGADYRAFETVVSLPASYAVDAHPNPASPARLSSAESITQLRDGGQPDSALRASA